MGDRYHLTLNCIKCNTEHEDVFYAPSCCFCTFECKSCGYKNGIAMRFVAVEIQHAQCDCGGECLESNYLL
jgi:hypothetical protein